VDEMYSAMPGSPITYLAGDISAGQTTIAVADDTALPDAPNICTIGSWGAYRDYKVWGQV